MSHSRAPERVRFREAPVVIAGVPATAKHPLCTNTSVKSLSDAQQNRADMLAHARKPASSIAQWSSPYLLRNRELRALRDLLLPSPTVAHLRLPLQVTIPLMSGSGGDRGYDYQADGYAYVVAHGLSGQPLNWFDDPADIPAAVLMETGGPGDDQQIATLGGRRIELQAKHALKQGKKFDAALRNMVRGLGKDPALRCAIMVDRHASEVIREDLRLDMIRLGQGRDDDLKPISKEVLKKLRQDGISTAGLFARLRIVVVDLDEGSDGVAAACAMLGRVVKPSNAQTAWQLLGKRGHRLTKERGRDEMWRAAEYLSKEVGLRQGISSPFAALVRFRGWMETVTGDFYSPAIGRKFPIKQAWNTIRTLEPKQERETPGLFGSEALTAEIRRYHEWHRLAEKSYPDQSTEADYWLRLHRRAVIVGGPGAGKSTLSKRITHYLTLEGQLVLRVRLGTVARLMGRGRSFDEALGAVALDKSGVPQENAEALLSAPDTLVADGLDECDPIRAEIAAALRAWADGHSNTTVAVFTRPVGHVPDLLPGFEHAELLPLDREAIRNRVEWFTQALIGDPTKAAMACAAFMLEVVDRSQPSVASIATRNPLLLSFLVRLHLDGASVQGQRARLFENIIELMRKTSPLDRAQTEDLDRATAWRVAEILGWECLKQPDKSVAMLMDSLAQQLGGDAHAARRGEAAVKFWEERGLIERLTLGSLDAITFVHPALGEYAAGRHLAKVPPGMLAESVRRIARQAQYRETVLLAAGSGAVTTIVDTLLNEDAADDPASTEAILAAAALAEAEVGSCDPLLVERVANHLCARLQSPVPLVTIEAGAGLVTIAPVVPKVVGELGASLWDHPQSWTRLAARAACLAAGPQFIDIDRVRLWVEGFQPVYELPRFANRTTEMPNGAHDLQARALELAVRRLITELEQNEAKRVVVALLKKRNLSANMEAKVQAVLQLPSCSEWTREVDLGARSQADFAESMARASMQWKKSNHFFLKCVLKATAPKGSSASSPTENCIHMAQILTAMRFWESPAADWAGLSKGADPDVVSEVVRGTIAALGLDPDLVAREANSLLHDSDEHWSPWSRRVPHIAVDVQWEQARSSRLDSGKLIAGLQHPCWPIAVTAAELLAAGAGGDGVATALRNVLTNGTDRVLLLVGAIAKDIWGEAAFTIIDQRLGQSLTPGCGNLYAYLAQYAPADQTEAVIERAFQGLRAENAGVAAGAAKMLRDMDVKLLKPRAEVLRAAMKSWAERGSWCDRCQRVVKTGSCDKCQLVAPTPRPFLTEILALLGVLSVDELVELTKDIWDRVPSVARKALAQYAAKDQVIMGDVLQKISNGSVGIEALNDILELPAEILRTCSDLLQKLCESERPSVRAKMAGALTGAWLDRQRALQIAHTALTDSDPSVRNSATLSVRVLSS